MTPGANPSFPPQDQKSLHPVLIPLGDSTILVRFGDRLNDWANQQAIAAANTLHTATITGVDEVTPNLISVALRYNPAKTGFMQLSGEIRLALSHVGHTSIEPVKTHNIEIVYGGESGPHLQTAAAACKLTPGEFIKAHNEAELRVLATGFAPGFVYCGLHQAPLHVPRRQTLQARVSSGSVLFAAGQSAITATPVPTGWHVIGHTEFHNFHPDKTPPTKLRAGEGIRFCGGMSE